MTSLSCLCDELEGSRTSSRKSIDAGNYKSGPSRQSTLGERPGHGAGTGITEA